MGEIFALLVAFQVKHFLADYPLQTTYMLGKFRGGWGWIRPLMEHCHVHMLFTTAISVVWLAQHASWAKEGGLRIACTALGLGALDFCLHFIMDRIKAGPRYLGRFKALTASEWATATSSQRLGNKLFWWSLGFDQMFHHLTHYLIIYLLIRATA